MRLARDEHFELLFLQADAERARLAFQARAAELLAQYGARGIDAATGELLGAPEPERARDGVGGAPPPPPAAPPPPPEEHHA